MTIYERIKDLASENNISIRELENRLGFSNGTLRQWKDSTKSSSLEKVADFFQVTIDYLLGKTNVKYTVEGGFYDKRGNFNPIGRKVSLKVAEYNERAILLTTFDILNNLSFLNGGNHGTADIEDMRRYTSDDYQKIADIEKEELAELTVNLFGWLTTPNAERREKTKKLVNKLLIKLALDDFSDIE